MEQKQYDAMQIIMQCSRAYADQMKKCLENSGLVEKGFHLTVNIAPTVVKPNKAWCDIELSEYITDVGEERYDKSCMIQHRYDGMDWSVWFDPKAEAGTVPENYGSKPTRDVSERVATVSEHPYPMDGFWISSRDDDPVLDGGQ